MNMTKCELQELMKFFKREGMMHIEYDRCVDVHWFSWEEE